MPQKATIVRKKKVCPLIFCPRVPPPGPLLSETLQKYSCLKKNEFFGEHPSRVVQKLNLTDPKFQGWKFREGFTSFGIYEIYECYGFNPRLNRNLALLSNRNLDKIAPNSRLSNFQLKVNYSGSCYLHLYSSRDNNGFKPKCSRSG